MTMSNAISVNSKSDRAFGIINFVLLAAFVLAALYPFIYVLSASISHGDEVASGRVVLFPRDITFAAFNQVFSDMEFWVTYGNTLFYTFAGVAVSLAFVVPGAYALSKSRLRGRRFFNLMIAFTMWFHAGMIPFFLNMRDLGLLDSRFGYLIGFACSAFNIILLRNYFEAISPAFEEAAKLEGASDWQIFYKIFVPLSKPAIITVGLFFAVFRWNGYFWAMILLKDETKIPLQVYLKKIVVEQNFDDVVAAVSLDAAYSLETMIYAIIVSSVVPMLLFYPYIQKYFNKGALLGGVKE